MTTIQAFTIFFIVITNFASGLLLPKTTSNLKLRSLGTSNTQSTLLFSNLDEKVNGYTVKQRLREEVESPFRKVRLVFFASSTGSALTALYFSTLSAFKASVGGFSDAPPLEEALTSCGINAAAAVICALLAFRDYKVGQANLERIAKGGELARLRVSSAKTEEKSSLSDYRRNSRILIAAGGEKYVTTLARSLNSDQLSDENTLPAALNDVDVMVVPVLLKNEVGAVGDTRNCWKATIPEDGDRNFSIERADNVISFPINERAWEEYLASEVKTANNQGFDVLGKGFTITIKKNGRILRRATGQPRWGDFIGAMEVLDGQFGMPGDSERYGGQ